MTRHPTALYDADIDETERRDGSFIATLRGHPDVMVISRDPEHDFCFALAQAGLPEGSIQFWRGTTPSLRYASVHHTAQHRVELGQACPYRRVRRRSSEDLKFSRSGHDGQLDLDARDRDGTDRLSPPVVTDTATGSSPTSTTTAPSARKPAAPSSSIGEHDDR